MKRTSLALLAIFLFEMCASAQTRARITRPVDNSARTTLRGSVHRLARAAFETGRVNPDLAMEKMILLLNPGSDAESDMRTFLDSQQTPGSPDFHQWLTPDQFGQRFGAAPEDIAKVTDWLTAQGFSVDSVARGGLTLQFSGTARQVERVFQTEMHRYRVNGVDHIANSRDISVPAALAPAIQAVVSLHDFFSKPIARNVTPEAVLPSNGGSTNALSPADFASIYNLNPLYQAGFNGAGQTIAVIGKSDFLMSDYQLFRSMFNLPPTLPNVITSGVDPGLVTVGPFGGPPIIEATLDPQWAGGVAPGATIDLVIAADTATSDGLLLAATYAVEQNTASVISLSFANCEANINGQSNALAKFLWQQAAAQGISVFVGAGDAGAADCDDPFRQSETVATRGAGVNGLASTPYNTAVGGSEFNEAAAGGSANFWNTTNGPGFLSVLGYVPEMVWNESQGSLAAGGGGASMLYSKPSWQTLAIPGIPQDGRRDLPDIALTAANHDGYIFCLAGVCQPGGGTSFAAPAFAGIMAIIDQKLGGRQGLANYALYALAARENFSNCNSSTRTNPAVPANPLCPFNDITVGNNGVPGQPGFNAGVGYDLASGLGSVNASVLANAWSSLAAGFRGTKTTLTTLGTSINITHGQPVPVFVTVAPQSGSGTPTGLVAFETTGMGASANPLFSGPLSNAATGGLITSLPGGSYNLFAHYAGDGTFAASVSNSIPVTVSPENTRTTLGFDTTVIPVNTDLPEFNLPATASVPAGSLAVVHAIVAPVSGFGNGFPSGNIAFFDNGQPVASLPLNAVGQAELNLCFEPVADPCPSAGTHVYTTIYYGDASFIGSHSGAATLTVVGSGTPPPGAGKISLWQNTLIAPGGSAKLPVTLSVPAPQGGVTVTLTSSDPSKVTVTPSVFIPAGRTQPNQQPQVNGINFGTVTISASAPGFTGDAQNVTVIGSLSFARGSVTLYSATTQNLTLNLTAFNVPAPAPAGLTINLSSDNPLIATVPSTVTFAAGASSVQIPVSELGVGSTVLHASDLPALADTTASVTVE